MYDVHTIDLDKKVALMNTLDTDTEYSWQFEGMDTEPYVFLHIGDVARIRGTIMDMVDLLDDMIESLDEHLRTQQQA